MLVLFWISLWTFGLDMQLFLEKCEKSAFAGLSILNITKQIVTLTKPTGYKAVKKVM
jgi:hypothetical protein